MVLKNQLSRGQAGCYRRRAQHASVNRTCAGRRYHGNPVPHPTLRLSVRRRLAHGTGLARLPRSGFGGGGPVHVQGSLRPRSALQRFARGAFSGGGGDGRGNIGHQDLWKHQPCGPSLLQGSRQSLQDMLCVDTQERRPGGHYLRFVLAGFPARHAARRNAVVPLLRVDQPTRVHPVSRAWRGDSLVTHQPVCDRAFPPAVPRRGGTPWIDPRRPASRGAARATDRLTARTHRRPSRR